ncbi:MULTISPECIES: TetR/AcrR family transcriptional regulator [unclassified Modestobacter]|uniref:TetR/AcrR family transcriptional regulator n=1 Tax=unclassified Modestobacter TaxID=2643866 RepID=UPI0022AA1B62|nr:MULTISPECIES: TetR/AcrR family transcriptional regulator [unclassified Modestobacter]MCZ2810705.1 helix-turn-helix domain containing protein [Modestobacter sp. VKM Ac-2979]MCZ2840218.1 helix-turn-helix domain containing protein [Modestobacter sp. VKM Ac-2980]MCZ2849343.1 helix-turn-helix domain containing protein [Modestobacter sp. VKM Ac-2978]
MPARRADAERNRERILAAARTGFAEPGAPLSMAEVARRAGVGMATLYRNFPGRRDLLEALYTDQVDAVCAAAASVDGSPSDRFLSWVDHFVGFFASKHEIAAELLAQAEGPGPVLDRSRERVMAAGRPLLAAAQEAGEIRGDLTLEQVLDMVIAVSAIHGDPDYSRPILVAALDGLRVTGSRR